MKSLIKVKSLHFLCSLELCNNERAAKIIDGEHSSFISSVLEQYNGGGPPFTFSIPKQDIGDRRITFQRNDLLFFFFFMRNYPEPNFKTIKYRYHLHILSFLIKSLEYIFIFLYQNLEILRILNPVKTFFYQKIRNIFFAIQSSKTIGSTNYIRKKKI